MLQSPELKSDAVQDSARNASLRATGLLDSPAEEAFDRYSRLASRLLKAPVALVSLVDERRQFFKSAIGLSEPWSTIRETPLSHSFCQHVVRRAEPLVVRDARDHALVKENGAIADLGVISYIGVPIRLRSGAVIGSFCAIDGEAREWSEEDLRTLEDLSASVVAEIELRGALRAQDEVLAIVSHDLKNPIAAMMLSAELLTRKVERGEVAQVSDLLPALKRLRGLGTRMQSLVHEVLDQAREAGAQISLNLSHENAEDILRAALEGVETVAAEKGVALKLAVDPSAIQISCDRARLMQVIGNLASNAVEYTPAGKTVSVHAEAAGESIRLYVCDEGPGVPTEMRDKIFEKFWRAPGSTGRGHGLGLYIVRTLVRAHGGEIHLLDIPGKGGACFCVELPACAAPTYH